MNNKTSMQRKIRLSRLALAGLLAGLLGLMLAMPGTAAVQTGPFAVTVDLKASPFPVEVGQPVDLQVKVMGVQTAQVPDGTVTIQADEGGSCTITLDGLGEGACQMTFAGSDRVVLRAVYPGSTAFLAGSSEKVLLPVVYPGDYLVFVDDFETPAGQAINPLHTVALNQEEFLGRFGNDALVLSLNGLAPHGWVRVTFDLYIIGSWDGNLIVGDSTGSAVLMPGLEAPRGPDHWQFQVDDEIRLKTTFSNWNFFLQAYPGQAGSGAFPFQTGARDIGHLGYTFGGNRMDATYRMDYWLFHTADSLSLAFSAAGLQALDDESWGLDNLIVSLNDAPIYRLYLPFSTY